jgi:chromosome condensin MukBEF ATPase and DNA-binding subunit MukB
MELRMDAADLEARQGKYKTSHRVQAWFLGRSRRRWKEKYKELKVQAKRLQNRVADLTKSREKWREQAGQLSQRVQELQAQNAALLAEAATLKKYGPGAGPGLE